MYLRDLISVPNYINDLQNNVSTCTVEATPSLMTYLHGC